VFTNRDASTVVDASRDAIGAATRANVAIYSIDPRGLTSMGDEMIEVDSFPTDDPGAGISATGMMDELRLAQDSLRTLSDETGGFASVNRNDFEGAFERIVRDNSTYYVLGYYPTNDRRDGRFRKIEVRVKRPGLQVRSRKGYQAPRGRAPQNTTAAPPNVSAAMRDAMNSPLPMSGLPMQVFATALKGAAPNATVALAIEMKPGDLSAADKGDDLHISFRALDTRGNVKPGPATTLPRTALKPEQIARIRDRGFRLVTRIDLPPGRYQLRVAASHGDAKAGSVHYDLEIPDFWKAPLTMSGIALTSASSGQMPTNRENDPLRDLLPGPPIATRQFQRDDELALFAEFYENAPGAPAHKLDIVTTIRSDDGRVVLQNQEERASTELQGGRGGYGFATRIPLKDFAPGVYVLHIEGKSRAAADRGVGRDIEIRIR
jgi:hypothetical protein